MAVVRPLTAWLWLTWLRTLGDAAGTYFQPMTALQIKQANRTNLCPILQKINAGTVAVDQALAGMTIQAAIHYGTPPFAMIIDNTTGLPTGGFYYALQQEIARRGKFTFKYNNVPNCMVTLGTQKCLQYNLPHFDIYANNWYSDTSGRRYVGIGYTAELVDASVVFVSTNLNPNSGGSKTTSNYLWSILKPFSVQVSEWCGQAAIREGPRDCRFTCVLLVFHGGGWVVRVGVGGDPGGGRVQHLRQLHLGGTHHQRMAAQSRGSYPFPSPESLFVLCMI